MKNKYRILQVGDTYTPQKRIFGFLWVRVAPSVMTFAAALRLIRVHNNKSLQRHKFVLNDSDLYLFPGDDCES